MIPSLTIALIYAISRFFQAEIGSRCNKRRDGTLFEVRISTTRNEVTEIWLAPVAVPAI